MTRYFIIGHTGFVGKNFASILLDRNLDFTGISGSNIKLVGQRLGQSRDSDPRSTVEFLLSQDISQDCLVINASWISNHSTNRDNNAHLEWADKEIKIIDSLKRTNCTYISIGSIAEIDEASISASAHSSYSKGKKNVLNHLASNFRKWHWARVASAYGEGDSRDWLVTQLRLKGEELLIRNETALLNLTNIDAICASVLEQIESENWGKFNYWSKQWMTTKNIKNCFLDGGKPILETPDFYAFTARDVEGIEVKTSSISDFFKK